MYEVGRRYVHFSSGCFASGSCSRLSSALSYIVMRLFFSLNLPCVAVGGADNYAPAVKVPSPVFSNFAMTEETPVIAVSVCVR